MSKLLITRVDCCIDASIVDQPTNVAWRCAAVGGRFELLARSEFDDVVVVWQCDSVLIVANQSESMVSCRCRSQCERRATVCRCEMKFFNRRGFLGAVCSCFLCAAVILTVTCCTFSVDYETRHACTKSYITLLGASHERTTRNRSALSILSHNRERERINRTKHKCPIDRSKLFDSNAKNIIFSKQSQREDRVKKINDRHV
jgi:hypothetical protein